MREQDDQGVRATVTASVFLAGDLTASVLRPLMLGASHRAKRSRATLAESCRWAKTSAHRGCESMPRPGLFDITVASACVPATVGRGVADAAAYPP